MQPGVEKEKFNLRLKLQVTSGKLQAMQPEVVWISLIKI